MSLFDEIEQLPEDPIFNLPVLFAADKNPKKVNLSIGAYRNEEGQSVILECIRKAEEALIQQRISKDYLPIEGLAAFREETTKLLLGPTLNNTLHSFTAQTVGGTSALRIGGEFLFRNGIKNIYLPEVTWTNHHLIFTRIAMKPHTYPYYDAKRHKLAFSEMWRALKQLPERSVVLLHACCHNPSGLDPSPEQWEELSKLMLEHQLIPFFDIAYQGFGDSLETDAASIRHFVQKGHECLIANSYSKNLGLYSERVGSLTAIAKKKEASNSIASHFKQLIRSSYSNPPSHGARLVASILQDADLRLLWEKELENMRSRIRKNRELLADGLNRHSLPLDMSFLNNQKGIFSFTGLNEKQVLLLREKFAIYLTKDGRANIAGVNKSNLEYIIEAFSSVMKT